MGNLVDLIVPYTTPSGAGTGDMLKANNLGDVVSVPQARLNLDVLSVSEVFGRVQSSAVGGLIFDGTTQKSGTVSSFPTIGTGDVSFRWCGRVPTSYATTAVMLGCGSGTSFYVSGGFEVYIDTNGKLYVVLLETPGTTENRYHLSNFVATYSGQVIDLKVTRSGSTLTLYINGVAVSMTPSNVGSPSGWGSAITSSTFFIGNNSTAGVNTTYTSGIYAVQVFNVALSQAEVLEIMRTGVPQRMKSVTWTALYDTDVAGKWDTGTDSWSTLLGSVTQQASQSDGTTTKNSVLKFTLSGGSGYHGAYKAGLSPGLQKSYRIRGWVYCPSANAQAKKITLQLSGSSTTILAPTSAATWTYFDGTITTDFATGGPLFVACTSGGSPTVNGDGDVFYLAGVTMTASGCGFDPDLTTGLGYWFPDLSGNDLNVEMTVGGWIHKLAKRSGEFVVVKTLNHSDISATAATTVLLNLPPNAGIMDVEFDRETAFDAGVTVDIGITGTTNKFVSALDVVTTGKTLSDSLAKVSQSGTAATAVYVKKSGATTRGKCTMRVRCIQRG